MLDCIQKVSREKQADYRFSVLLPSWNNLPYLQLCIRSIQENSVLPIQIIVIINEGKDGTKEWVENQPTLSYVYAKENIGICYGLNIARALIQSEYIVYVNDDMYLLPEWDTNLWAVIEGIGHRNFMLSATMIEHTDTQNPCVVVQDFGKEIATFEEKRLLETYKNLAIADWSGSTWPPNVVHIDMWDLVGGMSIEYSPGMYSDPDLARKLWEVGVREFRGVGNSFAYHFGSKSTKRIKHNKGKKMFIGKWGMTSGTFTTLFLKKGNKYQKGLPEVLVNTTTKWKNRLKRLKNAW